MSQYTPTIGIECHVQLKTKTKLFSSVGNDAREAPPNTLVSHICLGMPGALPVLNKSAVDLAIKAANALNTRAQNYSAFDRKHYFYPDLPKGYQITQLYFPIIIGGDVELNIDGQVKKVGITRAHLEEDAGKNMHPSGKDFSLVDLNRAGTPLLEIVSEPDMHSAKEAKAYARELFLLMKYSEVSEADLYYGNMRFDVNISVSNSDKLGDRAEIKNLNSFRSVEKAVEYEIKRQVEILEKGGHVVQETRGWDDAKQKTFSQRSKEDAHDYRYMPDPDIPPVVLEAEYIDRILQSMPILPNAIRSKLRALKLSSEIVEDIVSLPFTAHIVLRVLEKSDNDTARRIANWLMHFANKPDEIESENQPDEITVLPIDNLIKLSKMVDEEKLNSNAALDVFGEVMANNSDPQKIAESKNLLQVSDTAELEKIVEEVISTNQKASDDVRGGELKAIGFLVGQIMKNSGGKANPAVVQNILKQKLGL